MSDDLIRDAVTVHTKVLSNAVCLQCIELCEAKYGLISPFNGITALRIMASKASGARLEWIFSAIVDGIQMDFFDPSEFSTRKLQQANKKALWTS